MARRPRYSQSLLVSAIARAGCLGPNLSTGFRVSAENKLAGRPFSPMTALRSSDPAKSASDGFNAPAVAAYLGIRSGSKPGLVKPTSPGCNPPFQYRCRTWCFWVRLFSVLPAPRSSALSTRRLALVELLRPAPARLAAAHRLAVCAQRRYPGNLSSRSLSWPTKPLLRKKVPIRSN